MAGEESSSKIDKSSNKRKGDLKKKAKDDEKEKLDSYDRVLLDTFPASDAVAKY